MIRRLRHPLDLRSLLGALLLGASLGASMPGCPRLPPVSGCSPGAQRCAEDTPEVCSATGRWHRAGDVPCAQVGGTCAERDGVARCVRGGAR